MCGSPWAGGGRGCGCICIWGCACGRGCGCATLAVPVVAPWPLNFLSGGRKGERVLMEQGWEEDEEEEE